MHWGLSITLNTHNKRTATDINSSLTVHSTCHVLWTCMSAQIALIMQTSPSYLLVFYYYFHLLPVFCILVICLLPFHPFYLLKLWSHLPQFVDFISERAISAVRGAEREKKRRRATVGNKKGWIEEIWKRWGWRMKDGRVISLPWPASLQVNERHVFRSWFTAEPCHSDIQAAMWRQRRWRKEQKSWELSRCRLAASTDWV